MIEIACTCEDGFGVAHSHILESRIVQSTDPYDPRPRGVRSFDTGWVRMWVDWKSLAAAPVEDGETQQ